MKILVTGGAGFAGSHIVDRLIADKRDIVCLIRKEANPRWLKDVGDKVEIRFGDFLYPETLDGAFKDVDTVIHTAGLLNSNDWHNYYLINFLGTKNIIKACVDAGTVKRFIYFSSQNAAGPAENGEAKSENMPNKPVSHFGKSKLLAEEEVLKLKDTMHVTILRPTFVYGPRNMILCKYFSYAQNGLFICLGSMDKIVNLCFIDDLVEGVMSVLDRNSASGEIFSLGGQNVSAREIKDVFSAVMGKETTTVVIPAVVLSAVAYLLDIVGRMTKRPASLNRDRVNDMRQTNWAVSLDKARRMLNYTPATSLKDGISMTYEWYKKMKMI